MTVSSTTDRATFIGNGITTSFPLPFRFFADADIQASLVDNETFEQQDLVLGVDFTLIGAGHPEMEGNAASVINLIIPAPTADFSLFVQRVMAMEQPTDIVNQGRFHAEIHENVFDRLTMLAQQAALGPSRTIQVQPFDPIPGRLPNFGARANKVFGFDENGDPVVSSLSLQDMEQQPQIAQQYAAQAAGSASASASSAGASESAAEAAEQSKNEAEDIAESLTGAAVPLLAIMPFPSRLSIEAGYVAQDGQLLSRATYPDAWAQVELIGHYVTDAEWLADPLKRGFFSSGDGSTTFRLPDANGKQAGSLGAVVFRGDGALSAGQAGLIQRDAMQGHWHQAVSGGPGGGVSYVPGSERESNPVDIQSDPVRDPISDGVNGAPRTSSETRALNLTVVWTTKLFGALVNVGSADAAQLASDYANLAGRTSALESIGKPFTKEYVSAGQVPVVGGLITLSHELGVIPALVHCELHCIAAVNGYSVGSVIDAPQVGLGTSGNDGASVRRTSSQIIIKLGSSGGLPILDANTGAQVRISASQWNLVVRAWA